MIFKRVAAGLRAQNWIAIAIEVVIVIVGVFVGTQVSNWNAARLEKRETEQMIAQLGPSLQLLSDFYPRARTYYATTRRYADTAIAGWQNDPRVSDRDFVAAAYQSSQIFGIGANGSSWATVLGAQRLRLIDDEAIRRDLLFLTTADYSQLDLVAVNTPYRQNVRRIIPADVQDAIRTQCGDRPPPGQPLQIYLPPTCALKISGQRVSTAAQALRKHPELRDDLQWQLAAEAALVSNMAPFETTTHSLQRRIGELEQ